MSTKKPLRKRITLRLDRRVYEELKAGADIAGVPGVPMTKRDFEIIAAIIAGKWDFYELEERR